MRDERNSPIGTRHRRNGNGNHNQAADSPFCFTNQEDIIKSKMASLNKMANDSCVCRDDSSRKCQSRDCVGEKIRSIPQPAHLAALKEFDDVNSSPVHHLSQKPTYVIAETDEATFIYPQNKVVYLDSPDYSDDDPNKDSLQSNSSGRALLARTAREIASTERLPTVPEAAFGSCISMDKTMKEASNMAHLLQGDQLPKKYVYLKNLLCLSICFMFVFTSFFSVRTLQSSINHNGGLGLFALSTFYCSYVCGCIFAPLVIQKARPKWTMFCGIFGHLFFNAANCYPAYYTLIPGACFAGFGTALLLIAQGTYLSSIACSYSIVTQRKIEYVMTTFCGVFILFVQSGQILGNIISSAILKNLAPLIDPEYYHLKLAVPQPVVMNLTKDYAIIADNPEIVEDMNSITQNITMCGINYCHWHELDMSTYQISPRVLYVLMGTYTICILLALVMNGCFVNKLDIIFQMSKKSVWQQLTSVCHLYADKKMMLLFGMLCYQAFLQSFTFGDVVKAFVTCSIGVHMVGYTVICYGLCASLLGAISGILQKLVGRITLITFGVAGSCSLYVLMILWPPDPERIYMFFLIFGGLGVVDGILMTQMNSLVGLLFQKKEPAFAFAKMHQALTLALSFGVSQFVCMKLKIILGLSFLAVSYTLYITLEVILRKEKKSKKTGKEPKPVNV